MKAPCCGQSAEVATPCDPDDRRHVHMEPRDGDLLICYQCFKWLVKTATGLRLFAIEDYLQVPDEELNRLRRSTAMLKHYRRVHGNER